MIQLSSLMRSGVSELAADGRPANLKIDDLPPVLQKLVPAELSGEELQAVLAQLAGFAEQLEAQEAAFATDLDMSALEQTNVPEQFTEAARRVWAEAGGDGREPMEQSLTPEQWLAGMLGQQGLAIEAREAGKRAQPAMPASSTVATPELGQPVSAERPWPVLGATSFSMPLAGAVNPLDAPALGQSLEHAALPSATALDAGQPNATASPLERLAASLAPQDGMRASAAGFEQTVRLQAPESRWGEQMLQALRNNVEMQLQQRVQHASIRLDPPELGGLDILLSHESGRLSVQISAANGDVARLLQQTSERLRQELVGQNFLHVEVQVSSNGQQGRQGQRQEASLPGFNESIRAAADEAGDSSADRGERGRGEDVLVTV